MSFKIGDTVRLKSGGPRMTVSSVPSGPNEEVCCKWFNPADELLESTFPSGALAKAGSGSSRESTSKKSSSMSDDFNASADIADE